MEHIKRQKWEEETGDYCCRARYYDPSEGRFLSEDPIERIARKQFLTPKAPKGITTTMGESQFSGGDMDLYRYVTNDPISNSDSSGLESNNEDKKKNRSWELCKRAFYKLIGIPTPKSTSVTTPTPTPIPESEQKTECQKKQQANKELLNTPACQQKPDQPVCKNAQEDPCIIKDYDNGMRKE